MEVNKTKKTLREIVWGGIGILTLASCTTFKPVQREARLVNIEFFKNYKMSVEYDTDGDDWGDTKYFYTVMPEQNILWFLEPYAVARDKNRNHEYEDNEIEYIEERGKTI